MAERKPLPDSPYVGLTSTVPVEILLAAGRIPVDLNNIFITSADAAGWVEEAEEKGFPRTLCSWIKGIFSALQRRPEIQTVIAVTQGDCSNTQALTEILQDQGIRVIHFQYPPQKEVEALREQMERLMNRLGTDWDKVLKMKRRLNPLRRKLAELDRETWAGNRVHGYENHYFLVSSSDFEGDPNRFEDRVEAFLKEIQGRPPWLASVRLGFVGIPPIQSGLYEFIETCGGRVVFNEIQRQFSMPDYRKGMVGQYLSYTYPYDVFGRLRDIQRAVMERQLDGLIHYTQTFCFRQIQDLLIRKYTKVPVLTLEGDKPGPIDGRTRLRLEAFIDLLRR